MATLRSVPFGSCGSGRHCAPFIFHMLSTAGDEVTTPYTLREKTTEKLLSAIAGNSQMFFFFFRNKAIFCYC